MAKFNKGDKVTILPRKPGQVDQGPGYVDAMSKHAGRVYTVDVAPTESGNVKLKGVGWVWHPDWLQLHKRKPLASAADMDALYA